MTWGWTQRTSDPRAMNSPSPDRNPWHNQVVVPLVALTLEESLCSLPQILTLFSSESAVLWAEFVCAG